MFDHCFGPKLRAASDCGTPEEFRQFAGMRSGLGASDERTAKGRDTEVRISMRRSMIFASILIGAVAVLSACTATETPKPGTNVPAASPLTSPTNSPAASPSGSPSADDKKIVGKADVLAGEWPGLDGASLKIEKKGEKYEIEIKTKDGSKKFEGTAKGDVIEFTRNGKNETIKAATAVETGLKWTKGEKNCVVITKGTEGYCKN